MSLAFDAQNLDSAVKAVYALAKERSRDSDVVFAQVGGQQQSKRPNAGGY